MKFLKRLIGFGIIAFILLNLVVIMHAYKLTHFADSSESKTPKLNQMTTLDKVKVLITGVSYPKPLNLSEPNLPFEEFVLKDQHQTHGWFIPAEKKPKGVVLIFHGYGGEKSSMLDKAYEFHHRGYSTVLIDFQGSGPTKGNQTTIGYFESEQVSNTYNYVQEKYPNDPILLFGTSMGAVSIMRAFHDNDQLNPESVILECPFGTMEKTVAARFKKMNLPKSPLTEMILFWGGTINGFWAFNHNPEEYAKSIKCPVLLISGMKDSKVSIEEIEIIHKNLAGEKHLLLLPNCGHENYLINGADQWRKEVSQFLER